MGVKGLFPWIKKYVPEALDDTDWSSFKNLTVALDASMTMHRFARSQGDWLRGLIFQVVTLRNHNITPVYCLDGEPPKEKEDCLKARVEQHKKAQDSDQVTFRISDQDIKRFTRWCKLLGVSWVQASGEADPLMVKMYTSGKVDAIWSEDGDLLTYGCGLLLRGWKGNTIQACRLDEILKKMSWTQEQFTRFCILLGTDYSDRMMGPVTAMRFITGSDPGAFPEIVRKKRIDVKHIERSKRAMELFKQRCKLEKLHVSKPSKTLQERLETEIESASQAWIGRVIKALL